MGFISGIMSLIFSPFKKVIKVTIAFNLIKKKKKSGEFGFWSYFFLLYFYGLVSFFFLVIMKFALHQLMEMTLMFFYGLIDANWSLEFSANGETNKSERRFYYKMWIKTSGTRRLRRRQAAHENRSGSSREVFDRTQTLTGRCRLTGTFYLLFSKFV